MSAAKRGTIVKDTTMNKGLLSYFKYGKTIVEPEPIAIIPTQFINSPLNVPSDDFVYKIRSIGDILVEKTDKSELPYTKDEIIKLEKLHYLGFRSKEVQDYIVKKTEYNMINSISECINYFSKKYKVKYITHNTLIEVVNKSTMTLIHVSEFTDSLSTEAIDAVCNFKLDDEDVYLCKYSSRSSDYILGSETLQNICCDINVHNNRVEHRDTLYVPTMKIVSNGINYDDRAILYPVNMKGIKAYLIVTLF